MTAIYCVKCRSITNTKQEKRETTAKGRNRLSGICVPDEQEKAGFDKIARSQKKEALRIGWKVLANPEAKECIENCLTKTRKQNK